LETLLANPALYAPEADHQHQKELARQRQEAQATLEAAELRWLEIHETLDGMGED
jgi:hypothetical protein